MGKIKLICDSMADLTKEQIEKYDIEVLPLTVILEDKEYKDLYYTGEILDIDGVCGGFNLGFAWLSSIVVGDDIC